ncbi:MAG: panthothenate synthetase [Planctomycetes bacterium]|nr:panthothenate synthetase [Planctomycetota bacterium]
MRMLMNVRIPHEPFNALVRSGTVGEVLQSILEETTPEAVYFTEQNGTRGAILIVDVAEPSSVPALAEPWFLKFNADVSFHIVMSPEDLGKSRLDELAKKWS